VPTTPAVISTPAVHPCTPHHTTPLVHVHAHPFTPPVHPSTYTFVTNPGCPTPDIHTQLQCVSAFCCCRRLPPQPPPPQTPGLPWRARWFCCLRCRYFADKVRDKVVADNPGKSMMDVNSIVCAMWRAETSFRFVRCPWAGLCVCEWVWVRCAVAHVQWLLCE
jgi:hypothetical protein